MSQARSARQRLKSHRQARRIQTFPKFASPRRKHRRPTLNSRKLLRNWPGPRPSKTSMTSLLKPCLAKRSTSLPHRSSRLAPQTNQQMTKSLRCLIRLPPPWHRRRAHQIRSPFATKKPALEVSLETREHGGEAGLDLSASQRLKTVRALNADLHPSLREPADVPPTGAANGSSKPPAAPDPIEDQINISMTQTLKALNVRPPISDHDGPGSLDDHDEQEKRGGFFSRFKRS